MRFLVSRVFWFNLLAALVLLAALFGYVNHRLDQYTHHGESLTVPDFTGLTLQQVKNLCEDKNLRYQVYDSVFYPDKSRHTVIEQKPKPRSKVKNNRTIYLTMNSADAPRVEVPDLIEGSRRQAELKLKSFDLKVGEYEYKPHPDENAVLAMKIDGEEVEPGTQVRKGTTIDLVLGDGLVGEKTRIDSSLVSGTISLEEARFILQANNLTLGDTYFDEGVDNRATAVVYRTEPSARSSPMVPKGTPVDLYLHEPYQQNQDDSLYAPDTIPMDTGQ